MEELLGKIKKIENDMKKLKKQNEEEITKKDQEIEELKKVNQQIKEQYEKAKNLNKKKEISLSTIQQEKKNLEEKYKEEIKQKDIKICSLEKENLQSKNEINRLLEKIKKFEQKKDKKIEKEKDKKIEKEKDKKIEKEKDKKIEKEKDMKIEQKKDMKIEKEKDMKSEKAEIGIIDQLTKEVGGNVHGKGIVKVTGSSEYDIDYSAKNTVEIHDDKKYFYSMNKKNSWLTYDFIKRKVHPTKYSITTPSTWFEDKPINWIIEGSNDNNNWEPLDTRKNERIFDQFDATTHTFDIKTPAKDYRFLRLRQNGINSSNNNFLCISSLEFYGTLSNSQQQLNKTKKLQTENFIIDQLTKEVGGNVHDKGIVKVTSSSSYNDNYSARNAVEIHNDSKYFYSFDEENSWLTYDFIKQKVHPTKYSITTPSTWFEDRTINWIIEGSNDNNNWEPLDTRKNERIFDQPDAATHTFDIKTPAKYYRYLRLHQNGKNSLNNNILCISSLDFYGTLS